MTRRLILAIIVSTALAGPAWTQAGKATTTKKSRAITAAQARDFIEGAEKRLLDLVVKASRADWVQQNFITADTDKLSADAQENLAAAITELATTAKIYEKLDLPPDLRRKLWLLKLSLAAPTPSNPAERAELTEIATALNGEYGRGKYCPQGATGKCYSDVDIIRTLAESRDPQQMLDLWRGWHAIAPPMKQRYARFVELANKGSREMGFADAGAMWRAGYDMPPDEFARELDRLWTQVRPLYESLHAYVRAQLSKKYGRDVVGPTGPIPAHVLGNIWAQQWGNIYPLVAPPAADPGYDLTEILKARKTDAKEMVRFGERFFTSLGFEPLPATFWERSLFIKPADRDVVCHASAWDLDSQLDLRIKMCIGPNEEDFTTIHHELGHNIYQRAYRHQSPLFQGSANDGFHEALGDTIALSITPEYLQQVGLIEKVPPASGDVGLLMRQALDKVAFLPFGLLVDQWRWKVFSGETKPADYNRAWWELRRKYQGVSEPDTRPADAFDPGAKYHVPANVPYTRYFLAHLLQFQFYRALCRQSGHTGPLHRCSFYGNKAAGEKLQQMMAMGASRPWPEALEALTGEKQMDAKAILDYFAPLKKWLDEQNAREGNKPGW
jgi:peptidyl-dipeptidase A